MVAMVTVWVEGAVSILSMQKMGPLRSQSGFKMAVRLISDWAFICCDDSLRRQTAERLELLSVCFGGGGLLPSCLFRERSVDESRSEVSFL